QKEYYQLFAYFNQCSEDGRGKYVNEGNVAPTVNVTSPQQDEKLAGLKKAQKEASERLAARLPSIDATQGDWETAARYEKGWIVATPVSVASSSGATLKVLGDSSVLVSGSSPATDIHEVVLRTDLPRVTA